HAGGSRRRSQVWRATVVYEVGDGRLIDRRYLIDVAVAAEMNLTRTDVVDFDAGSGHEFILHAEAVLIALRAGVAFFEHVQLSRRLWSSGIERSRHGTEGDAVQSRIVIEGRELSGGAVLREGVASVVDAYARAHKQFLAGPGSPSEADAGLKVPVVRISQRFI